MQTIYKYPLQITDLQTLWLPAGAEVLTVQVQRDEVYLWAIVNLDLPPTDERVFETIGTGGPVVSGGDIRRRYIATVQQSPFVWHVFERE